MAAPADAPTRYVPWFVGELESIGPDDRYRDAGFEIDVVPFEDGERELADTILPTYRQAIAYAQKHGSHLPIMVSANIVDALKKEVFDSCYAGLDLAIEAGQTPHVPRRELFRKLRELVKSDALLDELVRAADLLAEGKSDAANAALAKFLDDPMRSRPIGFYTWNDSLGRIFRRDRLLQTSFKLPDARLATAAAAVRSEASVEKAYRFHAEYLRVMTNPFSGCPPLADSAGFETWALLPACRSNETELQKKVLREERRALFDPMNEMIRRVRDGRLSLAPRSDSGFYDYEQHALEGYLLAPKNPEGKKVTFGAKYMERLEEAFKTGLAKARESHAKDLEAGVAPTSEVPTPASKPQLPLEPLPTVFRRIATAFDFLIAALEALVGGETLDKVRGFHPDGPMRSVRQELREIRALCHGLALIAADEVGLQWSELGAAKGIDEKESVAVAKKWMSDYASDPRVARDARFAVPVAVETDGDGRPVHIHCWGTFGVQFVKVKVRYTRPPAGVSVTEEAHYLLIADKFLAFKRPYGLGPLTRDEYRAVLGRSKTVGEAMDAFMR